MWDNNINGKGPMWDTKIVLDYVGQNIIQIIGRTNTVDAIFQSPACAGSLLRVLTLFLGSCEDATNIVEKSNWI